MISLFISPHRGASLYAARPEDGWKEIFLRAIRVYAFVAGLVGLSWGMRPLVDVYISRLPHAAARRSASSAMPDEQGPWRGHR